MRPTRTDWIALAAAALWPVLATGAAVPIVLDTDMASDCDDAGAVAILHALADRGEARILGMGTCVRNRWAAPALDAINTYYGRPDIPIGAINVDGPGLNRDSVYTEFLAKNFPNRLKDGRKAPEVVSVYRQILAGLGLAFLHIIHLHHQRLPNRQSVENSRELAGSKAEILPVFPTFLQHDENRSLSR